MLSTEIDEKVIDKLKKMKESGEVFNWNILIVLAVGIITASNLVLLKKNGDTIEREQKRRDSIFKRLNFVSRKSTTSKPIIILDLISEIGLTFYQIINKAANTYNIPVEPIINIDETPLPFLLISKYTMEEKAASIVLFHGLLIIEK